MLIAEAINVTQHSELAMSADKHLPDCSLFWIVHDLT